MKNVHVIVGENKVRLSDSSGEGFSESRVGIADEGFASEFVWYRREIPNGESEYFRTVCEQGWGYINKSATGTIDEGLNPDFVWYRPR